MQKLSRKLQLFDARHNCFKVFDSFFVELLSFPASAASNKGHFLHFQKVLLLAERILNQTTRTIFKKPELMFD